jgi:D-alanyl-D-alanine carboxypeptidase/D-alanyl-D-alanine-endopeptidase (penicillin-binding protein 4)
LQAAIMGGALALTLAGVAGSGPAGPGAVVPAAGQADAALTAALDQIVAHPRFADAMLAVDVRDVATGANVYSLQANKRVVPASTMKLLTTAAALEILGTDFRFATTVSAGGSRDDGTLRGDLYLKGHGDPTILAADYDRLAADVAAAGITKVTGKLVADDTWFDAQRLGTDWAWDDEPYSYAAQTSALTVAASANYETGSVAIERKPAAEPGRPVQVTVVPENSYIRVVNTATTVASGGGETSVDREHGAPTIIVSGSRTVGAPAERQLRSVWEPTRLAAAIFRDALARRGVEVVGDTVVAPTPDGVQRVAEHLSMPLGQLMVPLLKLSNNQHAEALVKAVARKAGKPGTWQQGIAVMTGALTNLGVDDDPLYRIDGSGLSRQNWLTARQISNLLVGAQAKPWFKTWYDALPIAGQPDLLVGGTLRNRLKEGPAAGNVHAKTGTLTGADALSGYVTDRSGRRLAFATVANFTFGYGAAAQQLDQIAATLAASGGTGVAALGAQPRAVTVPERKVSRAQNGKAVECSWVGDC